MGSAYAEGRGVGMSLNEDRLRVNQARFPVDLGNVMSQIRSPADLRKLGRPVAQNLMDRYCDQSLCIWLVRVVLITILNGLSLLIIIKISMKSWLTVLKHQPKPSLCC
jgi:hypothetical protein